MTSAVRLEPKHARYENGWYYCWLIERRDLPQPEWFGADCFWHKDANEAEWYARKSDADTMAGEMTDIDVVVCEHGFMLERPTADVPSVAEVVRDLQSQSKWLRMVAEEIASANNNGWGNTCTQAADGIDRAIALLSQTQQGEWIPVSDRLPPKYGDYLVTYQCRSMTGAFSEPGVRQALWTGEWELYQKERVTAWCELRAPYALPAPPKVAT